MKNKILLLLMVGMIWGMPLCTWGITQMTSPQTTSIGTGATNSLLDVLDLKGMDVLDVLKLISQKSGLNIVASQNVKGRVTIYLKNIDVMDALRIIVEAYGWSYAQDGDIIKIITDKEFEDKYGYKFGQKSSTRVKPLLFAKAADITTVLNQIKSSSGKIIQEDKSNTVILMDSPKKIEEMEMIIARLDVPLKTEVFQLSYAKVQDLSAKVTEVITPGVGSMRFDERSNTIVVSDTEHKMEEIKNIINAFDQKDKQVLIEAKIVQIVLSDEFKLGIDWQAILRNYEDLKFTGDFDVLSAADKSGKVSVGTIDNSNYEIVLQALSTVGVTDILSSPSITAVNNQEAKILVGSTEPYVTSTTTTPSSGPVTTAESVNFIDVGVQLYVTPTIHQDGFVTLKIKPEVSTVTDTLETSNNNTIPIVETSEAETTVLVKDGITIVIGGLIKEEKTKTTKKVPFLGDIPLINIAFKSENDSVSKTELVIFLTPHIVSGDANHVAMKSIY